MRPIWKGAISFGLVTIPVGLYSATESKRPSFRQLRDSDHSRIRYKKVAEAVIETLQSAKQNVLIQRFIGESRGRDVRALVIGDRVVAAMRRVANDDEFRSNVHRGGRTELVELDEEYEQVAVKAAQIMGLRIAGVDMLEGNDGPLVMEVNSSPGLEGIETATGKDIAGQIITSVEKHLKWKQDVVGLAEVGKPRLAS